jgi:phosphoribosyl 1,2-cyclic phosphodiesterase
MCLDLGRRFLIVTGGLQVSLKISVLGSGSSGNCTFISSSRTKILIDGGLSRLQTVKRLASIGESLDQIDAFLITHEHNDHIQGLPTILARNEIAVYLTPAVQDYLHPQLTIERLETMNSGAGFLVGDIQVTPFSIPHDAADPVGFNLEVEGIRVGYATDLGYLPELVIQRLKKCDVLVLESNHDLEMLKVGSYPWPVKQRIMSRLGHLSNDMTGKFFSEEHDNQSEYIVLAHLSRQNNHPDIARLVSGQVLESRGFDLDRLFLADQYLPTAVIQM